MNSWNFYAWIQLLYERNHKYIQEGKSTQARIFMNELAQIKDNRYLSQNHVQSMKYKIVAAITLFTRAVIDVGVPIANAYTLSDVYITK